MAMGLSRAVKMKNNRAICLAHDPQFEGDITTSGHKLANIFTKPLGHVAFLQFRSLLGLVGSLGCVSNQLDQYLGCDSTQRFVLGC